MFYSPCLLHLYHPLASLGAQCHQRTQGTRIIISVLGTGMKFGLVSVSTCWLFCHSCGTHVCIAAYPLQTACPEGRVAQWWLTQRQRHCAKAAEMIYGRRSLPCSSRGTSDCKGLLFLPKPVVEGGRDEPAMPNCSLSPLQAMFDCKQHWRPGRLFVHHWMCISFGTDQERIGAAKVWRSFPHFIELKLWDFPPGTCSASGKHIYWITIIPTWH